MFEFHFRNITFNNLTFCLLFSAFAYRSSLLIESVFDYYTTKKVFRIEMPGNQVPRNREEEHETNYCITMLRSA